MKHRILAFVCMLSILIGMLVMPETVGQSILVDAESEAYEVGYNQQK